MYWVECRRLNMKRKSQYLGWTGGATKSNRIRNEVYTKRSLKVTGIAAEKTKKTDRNGLDVLNKSIEKPEVRDEPKKKWTETCY